MRNLCVDDGITNNTRVLILEINRYRVRCQTLGDNSRSVSLPRIRFNFRLPYGRSFMMTRKQFLLRRAYCLSVHKSQGQTLGRVLVDARNPATEITLLSEDSFTDVDDDKGHLARMISEEVLKKYSANDVPPHDLK